MLPLQSEAALAGLLLTERHATTALLLAATVGNVAGSTLNGGLGRHLERFRQRRWFPLTPERLARIQSVYRRHGWWSLLLSWTPVIGDPLWRFLLVVTLVQGDPLRHSRLARPGLELTPAALHPWRWRGLAGLTPAARQPPGLDGGEIDAGNEFGGNTAAGR